MDLGGQTDYLAHQNKGHSRRIIHEDWKDLEGGDLGISFPDWDLSYFAGGRIMKKVIQPLAPPPNPLGLPQDNAGEGEMMKIKSNIMLV